MTSCVICGTSVGDRICELHEEDVVFEFRGSEPDELTPNRYYRGTVDGYAEFGVFVDIGDHVTGLLHKSELDQRLDSLDWEPGDAVYVQVQNIRDNGNVDLGWSIRQDESEFRGTLVDDPDADGAYLADEEDESGNAHGGATDGSSPAETDGVETETTEHLRRAADDAGGQVGAVSPADADSTADGGTGVETDDDPDAGTGTNTSAATAADVGVDEERTAGTDGTGDEDAGTDATRAEPEPVTVDGLAERVGDRVRVEGEIVSARQTGGPTVFELRDETGTVDCAAFEEAGVRAYPDVTAGDIVRLQGEVERRREELQVETAALSVLTDDEREAVTERMTAAMLERARPDPVQPLAADAAVQDCISGLRDAAAAIRRAVLEGRPVVVRHSATVDGYLAGVALERATLPLVREHTQRADAEYHQFDRRPLEGSVYEMADATKDVTTMLSNRARHDEGLPLFVFVAAGGSAESLDALDLLGVYDARRVLIDEGTVDGPVAEAVDELATPDVEDHTTATALAATAAVHVHDDARAELRHLPAVSFWTDTPEPYLDLAAEAGHDAEAVREMREAVALQAYYQSYEDKRELVADLLYGDGGLAADVAAQYRVRVDRAIETARANVERHEVGAETVLVLDTEAYTRGYEFPPTRLLLDELARRQDDAAAVVGLGADEAFVRGTVDTRAVVERAGEDAPEVGLDTRGAREGRVDFLAGERGAAREALLDALAAAL